MNQSGTSKTDRPNVANELPQIFKLNVDCFEHLFEWFSLKDLLEFRRTCKRVKQVVDYYIKLNYPRLLSLECANGIDFNELSESQCNSIEYINDIYLNTDELTETDIENIKYILRRAECIRLNCVTINVDFYDDFLTFCSGLKFLSIRALTLPELFLGNGNNWLLRHYPKLEHLELQICEAFNDPFASVEFVEFLSQNPKIQTFSTNSIYLSTIAPVILESNLKLDRLCVRVDEELGPMCDVLNALHKHGFYRRLHVCTYSDREDMQYISSLCALEKLYLWSSSENYDLPAVNSLIELSLGNIRDTPIDALHLMATKFINLKRVYIKSGCLRNVRPFFRFSAKVEHIIIKKLLNDINEDVEFNDVLLLNDERKQLNHANKITVYFDEKTFLKLKWTAKTNFSLIELKRSDSIDDERWI